MSPSASQAASYCINDIIGALIMMTQSIMTVLWRVGNHQIISNLYQKFLLLVVINYLVGFLYRYSLLL